MSAFSMRMGMGLGAPMQAVSGEIPESTINVGAVLDGATLEPAVSGDYYVWTFDTPVAGTSSSGTFTTDAELEIEALIIGGGGSGGGRNGGGGGAGGFLELMGEAALTLAADTEYEITVGKGGARTGSAADGNSGEQSSIIGGALNLYADGGGGGGNYAGARSGKNGGCGGGGSYSDGAAGVATQGSEGAVGYNGGAGRQNTVQGGGGGAAGAGTAGGNASPQGKGGDGVQSSITGTAVYYGAGGGGTGSSTYQPLGGLGNDGGKGGQATISSGQAAAPENRGHGGGGGSETKNLRIGGKGSDGVVIIRCLKAGVTPAAAPARASYGDGDTFIYEAEQYMSYGD